jgi:hypothetical protein
VGKHKRTNINDIITELQLDLIEVLAYRELDSQEFDFNDMPTRNTNEFNLGSEDAYYEMDIENINQAILDLKYQKYINRNIIKTKKPKLNQYQRKLIDRQKLKKLINYSWWTVYYHEEEDWYERCYVSGRKGYAKYCSRRKVRHTNEFKLKGNGYRKVYDYWWDVL